MKSFLKENLKTLIFFAAIGIIGGFLIGLFTIDSYPPELQAQLAAELQALGLGDFPTDLIIGITTALQSLGYGAVLGAAGIFIAKKIGLWKGERSLKKKPLIITAVFSVVGGIVMILPDLLLFGPLSEAIMNSYAEKPSLIYVIACVTYGAVIEEIMLRLFAMSLIAFILHKLFGKGKELPSDTTFILANVISALVFAISHLPATFLMLGDSPLLIARCIIMNASLALLFGYLYRKHGLRYAMLAHGGCHIVSKLIWLIFI